MCRTYFLVFAFLIGTCVAHAGGPSVESLTPPVGTRGESFQVSVVGASLDRVNQAIVYRDGLRCNRVEVISGDEIRLHMVAEKTAKLGSYPVRLKSPTGLSEMRLLTLSPFPVVNGEEYADRNVPMNHTVLGTLEGSEVDTYRFHVEAGQLISCDVQAMRLGGNFLDTKVDLYAPDGQLLLSVDDSILYKQDPCFSLTAKSPGIHRITVTSIDARADANSRYALHIGSFPRPTAIYPLGGACESNVTCQLLHDASSESKAYSFSTYGLVAGTHEVEVSIDGVDCPSPIPFRVVDGSFHVGTSQRSVELPCLLHGQLKKLGQSDSYSFRAVSSGRVRVEVFASRIGSTLDAVLEVQDSNGHSVARSDDYEGLDARLEFWAKAGETYTVSVNDKRDSFGTHHAYCLEIEAYQPQVTAFLPRRDKRSQSRQTIEIPRGNRVLGLIGVYKEGTDQKLNLRFPQLPSQIQAIASAEQPDSFVVPVVFEASTDAPDMAVLTQIVSVDGSGQVASIPFKQVVDLINGPADTLYQSAQAQSLTIAVTEPAPFRIELDSIEVPLSVDGSLEVKVRVERTSGFALPIDIRFTQLPEWVQAVEKSQIASDQSEASILLHAGSQAKPLTWSLVAEASVGVPAKASAGSMSTSAATLASPLDHPTVASSLRTLRIVEPPCSGTIQAISAEQGTKVKIRCKLDLAETVPAELVATLEGLPSRVKVEPVAVSKDQRECEFLMEVPADSPLGTFSKVFCRLSGESQGVAVSYCIARDTKLVISPTGAALKDESGQPLSPLEALRRKRSRVSNEGSR